MIFLELFYTFFLIGAFTFGGGYAMLPLIQAEVERKGWLPSEQIVNFIAVSESTPGPFAVNMATYVGAEMGGVFGSVCATLGVVLPSFIVILIVAKCYEIFRSSRIVKGCMSGLKPAVLGLIGTAALGLATPENFIDWKSYAICIAAFAALFTKKIGPFTALGLGALAGLILY